MDTLNKEKEYSNDYCRGIFFVRKTPHGSSRFFITRTGTKKVVEEFLKLVSAWGGYDCSALIGKNSQLFSGYEVAEDCVESTRLLLNKRFFMCEVNEGI
jgi:hypothetical protein